LEPPSKVNSTPTQVKVVWRLQDEDEEEEEKKK
jgi:hypothetical protein